MKIIIGNKGFILNYVTGISYITDNIFVNCCLPKLYMGTILSPRIIFNFENKRNSIMFHEITLDKNLSPISLGNEIIEVNIVDFAEALRWALSCLGTDSNDTDNILKSVIDEKILILL